MQRYGVHRCVAITMAGAACGVSDPGTVEVSAITCRASDDQASTEHNACNCTPAAGATVDPKGPAAGLRQVF